MHYLACSDISSGSAVSSVQYEHSRSRLFGVAAMEWTKDDVRPLIVSFRDTLYDYSWLRYSVSLYESVVYSISDVYRNT